MLTYFFFEYSLFWGEEFFLLSFRTLHTRRTIFCHILFILNRSNEIYTEDIYECRCDERLKAKYEGSTLLPYTRLCGGLEHLKIDTRLIDERFVSVMGECDLESISSPSILRLIRNTAPLVRMLPTFDLSCEENTARR
jgi:hypothetical protein